MPFSIDRGDLDTNNRAWDAAARLGNGEAGVARLEMLLVDIVLQVNKPALVRDDG